MFENHGMDLKLVRISDKAKEQPGRYRVYHKICYSVHPCNIDVEIHVCIWGGITYTDAYNVQIRQIVQIGGAKAMRSVIAGIHLAKQLFAQEGLYKTKLNHDAVPGVGIEQLIIQTGREGDNPLVIRTVPSLLKARAWILKSTNGLENATGNSMPHIPDINICHVPGICELGNVNFFDRLTLESWRKLRKLVKCKLNCD
jgi:hypothetical protein